ncbi:MAG: Bax inhibitor-1/YccA family protein [Actinobacteria bacterium]|nr:Bax inhibitor-1/YccA family protein [Actinomycetota bacterium]
MGLGNHNKQNDSWAPPTVQPMNDGPVSRWDGGIMTVAGTASATMMLLVLILASATVTWLSIDAPAPGALVQIPFAWVIGGFIIGFISVMVGSFKPHLARIAGPIYALAEGVVLGAISRAYSEQYNGIVLQAVGATLGVFVAMLVMYRTGIIRVNDKFRRVVMSAMVGLLIFYGVSFLFNLLGANITFFNDASLLGIGFSIFVAGLAAANLALDFDFIERGEKEGLPKQMEWFAALGVVITLVWLYLEILRLLAKLREN